MKKSIRLIIIIGVIVLVVILAVVAFLVLRKPKVTTPTEIVLTPEERARLQVTEQDKAKGITLEDKETELKKQKEQELKEGKKTTEEIKVVQIKKIIDKKIQTAVFSADKRKFLYFDPSGQEFYQINLDGTGDEVLTNGSFKDVYDISWSPDRKKIILTFSSDKGKTREYHYFDLETQKDVKYEPTNYQDVIVSFNGEKIAYIYQDQAKGEYNLSVANFDLSSWRKIRALEKNGIKLSWFSNKELAAYPSPSAYKEGELSIYNVAEGKDYYTIFSGRWGLSPLFSPDGKKVIFNDNETKNARFPVVWVSELKKGAKPRKLQLSTLVEKCNWAKDNVTIFCGIPENYSNFFIQPDDYYKGKFVSKDSFYKINTDNGEQIKLADASQFSQDYDVFSPLVSDDGKNVYFIRKHDGKFYELIIP